MLDAAGDGLLVIGPGGRPAECNARFQELSHWPADWPTRPADELWGLFSARAQPSDSLLSALRDSSPGAATTGSFTLRDRDGQEWECGSQPCRLDDGTIGRLWRFRDLTAFQGDTRLEQEREWFRVTLASIGDAVITTDTDAKVTFLNPVAEKMTGWTNAEARGQPLATVFRIVNELTRAEAANPVARVLRDGVIVGLANHTTLIDRQGRDTAIEDSAAPIRDAQGRVVGAVMVFHDVDARRRAERALARNEKLLADFFANAPVGLNWIGEDGRILRANRAELAIVGYPEKEYVGRRWAEFHVEPGRAVALFEVLKTGGTVEDSAASLRARDGSIREVLISANAFVENGRFVHARCFTRDVTDQNRAEAARAHLAALVASSDDAIVSKSLEGVIQSWNEGAERLFGYSAGEAIGQPITLIIPPGREEEEPAILERLKHGERVDHFETVRRRKDGRLVDVSLTISPILNAAGDIVGASKIARDISERHQAEQALREEYAIIDELNRVARALATELDLDRIVRIITEAGTRVSRAQFGAFLSSQPGDGGEAHRLGALTGLDRPAFDRLALPQRPALIQPTFRGEGVIRLADVRRDPRFERPEPASTPPAGGPLASYLAVPVFGRAGEVLGGLFFGHAAAGVFTERDEKIVEGVAAQASAALNTARLYEAEKRARASAESSNEAKDHFIAALSHELRTPLTPALAILTSLRDDAALPAPVLEDLETVRRNVLLEARLIDDLLDLTRISRGKLSLEEELIVVDDLIETAANICRPDLEGRELKLVRELRASTATIRGDRARLTQVLWNLLKNAIKFTPDGGTITLRSRVAPATAPVEVVVEVEDTGIGVEPDFLPRIFAAFDQGGQETTRRFGGLGLGLAISQAIVQAHRGKLEATSAGRNRGSRFTLTLPLASREAPAGSPGEARSATDETTARGEPPLRILLVEDHGDTARILIRLVKGWGHEVFHEKTVADALRTAEAEIAAGGLDLVISDLGLPDGSGLELMKTLSGRHGLTGIALSGYGMESDVQKSAAAGFARHLTKPVDLMQLHTAVQEFAAARNEPRRQA